MSDDPHTIAVDAMGADLGPGEVVAGAALALKAGHVLGGLVLVGDEDIIRAEMERQKIADDPRVKVFSASQVVTMDDKPVQALKQKKDSSLVRTVELVEIGSSAAGVSCGNTGALMACSTLRLRPMQGVLRPALATVWPRQHSRFLLLDGGANPQAKPEHLVQYALLGQEYAKAALGIAAPRIGLLSLGTEEGKGNELSLATHEQLKRLGDLIDYRGPVEGFQLFTDDVDVIVTDGFTGNVVLKSCEGLFKLFSGILKEEIKSNPLNMAGGLMLKGAFQNLKSRLHPERFGGAPLLGLRGSIIKAHGSSHREAIATAIGIAASVVEHDLIGHCSTAIAAANQRLEPTKKSPKAKKAQAANQPDEPADAAAAAG